MNSIIDELLADLPSAILMVFGLALLVIVHYFIRKRLSGQPGRKFVRPLVTIILVLAGIIIVILFAPIIKESSRVQLLQLIGVLLGAAIALSSTTLLGNALGGLMLRAIRGFRAGDFVQVGEHFGRVSEKGLFHVEIQTEDRDLTTLPNLYLVTHPVRVIRSSGTMITAEVSLGYDISRRKIEKVLCDAALEAGLEEPFVLVVDLGDFAVTYRVAGMLTDVKHIISARSRLRQMMMDKLQGSDIEIVSPTFMNTRAIDPGRRFIAHPEKPVPGEDKGKGLPEELIFDKADEAESLEKLQERLANMSQESDRLEKQIEALPEGAERDRLESRLEQLNANIENLAAFIDRRMENNK